MKTKLTNAERNEIARKFFAAALTAQIKKELAEKPK